MSECLTGCSSLAFVCKTWTIFAKRSSAEIYVRSVQNSVAEHQGGQEGSAAGHLRATLIGMKLLSR